MQILISFDDQSNEFVAVYFTVLEGEVHRTVEVEEGECYVDLDSENHVLGVEMLVPGHLKMMAKKVEVRFGLHGIGTAAEKARMALAA